MGRRGLAINATMALIQEDVRATVMPAGGLPGYVGN
jgi:hypothetical protein